MTYLRAHSVFLLAALSLFPFSLLAQTTSSLVGKVSDPQGLALPGVSVEASSASLQGVRRATTDTEGRYRLTLLPPGEYLVSFTLQGFAKETQKGVQVLLGKDTFARPKRTSHVSGRADPARLRQGRPQRGEDRRSDY